MKNKKLTYILVPLVVLIWGLIIYRIVNTVNGNDVPQPLNLETNTFQVQNNVLSDTFSLKLNYRDPFLGSFRKVNTNETPSSKVKNTQVVAIQPVVWPNIIYGGLIKNKNSDKQIAFIQINGQVNMMKAGDVINDIELTKIFKDSVEVRFGKQKMYISK